jgi:hypothetical protein
VLSIGVLLDCSSVSKSRISSLGATELLAVERPALRFSLALGCVGAAKKAERSNTSSSSSAGAGAADRTVLGG